jgi:hypothetical protein
MNLHKLHKLRKRQRPKPRSRMQRRMRTAVAVFGLTIGAVSGAHAQGMRKATLDVRESAAQLDARWRESLDGFAALDRARAPKTGGVVFVGSSSIRMWDGLEQAFADAGVVKRGFGGSRLSDCAHYV